MSELTTIETRLLGLCETVVAGIHVTWGDVEWDKLPGSELPHAFVQPFEKRPVPGDLGSEDRVIEGRLIIISALSIEDARAKGDLVEAAIVADRTLGGTVTAAFVAMDSGTEPTKQRHWARLTVTCTQTDGSMAVAGGPLMQWELQLRAVIRGATLATDYLIAKATEVAAALNGTRMLSDWESPPQQSVPAGATMFQLAALVSHQVRSSNQNVNPVNMVLRVFHRGAAGETERSYTEGAMIQQTIVLLDPEFWKTGFADVDVVGEDVPVINFPSDVARL